jgi:adenylate cyclase
VAAALAMQAFSETFAAEAAADGLPLGGTRIGVHWGEATVGNFGGETRVQYTAMGDAMNLASRLEGANKQLGTWVLASADILVGAGEVPARDMGSIAVKGRKAACHVFQLDLNLSSEDAAAHSELVRRLRAGDPEASIDLRRLLESRPEDLALAGLAARAARVGWNGVFQLDAK